MSGAIPPHLQYAFMAWCLVKKHRDNFTFLPLSLGETRFSYKILFEKPLKRRILEKL
jgi:hypothetical protein